MMRMMTVMVFLARMIAMIVMMITVIVIVMMMMAIKCSIQFASNTTNVKTVSKYKELGALVSPAKPFSVENI